MTEFNHIIRIANADLKGEKQILYALTNIRGVSYSFSNFVCTVAKVDKTKKTGYLTDKEVKTLSDVISNPKKFNIPLWLLNRRKDPETNEDKHIITDDMRFIQDNDVKILKKIKSYKGVRHMHGLPTRGQRTKSNFRKNKGSVIGVKRKKGKTDRP